MDDLAFTRTMAGGFSARLCSPPRARRRFAGKMGVFYGDGGIDLNL